MEADTGTNGAVVKAAAVLLDLEGLWGQAVDHLLVSAIALDTTIKLISHNAI